MFQVKKSSELSVNCLIKTTKMGLQHQFQFRPSFHYINLLITTSIRIKCYIFSIRRVRWRGINRRMICNPLYNSFSKSIVYISEFPSFAKLIIIFLPSGENLGANVMPGKSPTTSCIPVSISSK